MQSCLILRGFHRWLYLGVYPSQKQILETLYILEEFYRNKASDPDWHILPYVFRAIVFKATCSCSENSTEYDNTIYNENIFSSDLNRNFKLWKQQLHIWKQCHVLPETTCFFMKQHIQVLQQEKFTNHSDFQWKKESCYKLKGTIGSCGNKNVEFWKHYIYANYILLYGNSALRFWKQQCQNHSYFQWK